MKTCGAKTRGPGHRWKRNPMPSGRSYLHGGASTGPKTEEGKCQIAKAHRIHGRYSKQAIAKQQLLRKTMTQSMKSIEHAGL